MQAAACMAVHMLVDIHACAHMHSIRRQAWQFPAAAFTAQSHT